MLKRATIGGAGGARSVWRRRALLRELVRSSSEEKGLDGIARARKEEKDSRWRKDGGRASTAAARSVRRVPAGLNDDNVKMCHQSQVLW